MKDLIDTALELFVPHPGVETKEKAAEILQEEFLDALSDMNVSCLVVVACFRAEEDAKFGLIPGLTTEKIYGPAFELLKSIINNANKITTNFAKLVCS
ncbi:MAG: hypothetical protein ACUVQW_05570 [Candidatus Bathycorpusculaceae bacterium]